LQLFEDGTGKVMRIGKLESGERPQLVVPRGVWQGSRLISGGNWALLGCTVSPGFEFDDYETGDRSYLMEQWPEHREIIKALTRPAGSEARQTS
jgi:hypothetical protein